MPRGNPDIVKHAKKAGAASAEARKKAKSEKLTLSKVEAAFGVLETIEDAQRRLERLCVWAAAGLIAGSVAGAAVRSVEVWLKSAESKLTREVVEDLKREVGRIKAEVKRRPQAVA